MERDIRNLNDLVARLNAAEVALETGSGPEAIDCTSPAKRYAYAVMHEAVSPIESINNLVYIAKQTLDDPENLHIYLALLESQVERLNEIARRTLLFCKG